MNDREPETAILLEMARRYPGLRDEIEQPGQWLEVPDKNR